MSTSQNYITTDEFHYTSSRHSRRAHLIDCLENQSYQSYQQSIHKYEHFNDKALELFKKYVT